jgi:hypothetical protein
MKRFTMIMMAMVAIATAAFAQSKIYVYRNEGNTVTIPDSIIQGMECSKVDSQMVTHTNYVMQIIKTASGDVKIPLSEIDSISFVKPVKQAVDLGLSVKWANYNVGATEPEEYGGYYGWADPTGTKTTEKLIYYPSADPPGNISGTEYDIARAQWGGSWRMPTSKECKELFDSCTCTWTTQNGVDGMKAVGPNGNSIFLPAAGYRTGTDFYNAGLIGEYWSGTLVDSLPYNASVLGLVTYIPGFNTGPQFGVGYQFRSNGCPVRPVFSTISAITGSASDITLVSAKLTGTVIGTTVPHSTISWGMFYSTQSADVKSGTKIASNSSGDGSFSITLNDLVVHTTYYYCTYLKIDSTYYYGEVEKFTTKAYGEAVDLGLSVKWASYNVGATKPEEEGDHFGWADPTGTKISENLDDYPSANPPSNICCTEYDMARAKWGSNWRLPTKAEEQELIDKCTWTWTKQNEVKGYKVVGPNGNSIFLPAACDRKAGVMYGLEYGYYWSGTLNESDASYAYFVIFNSDSLLVDFNYRDYGYSVRPVFNLIGADTGSASNIGQTTVTLTGTVSGTLNPHSTISWGMFYSTESLDVKNGTKVVSSSSGDGNFSLSLNGLIAHTTYFYCAYLMIDGKYYYGYEKNFTTKDYEKAGDAVDLGLSVKWASCNVGATKPEEYGGYYGWADPSGLKTSTNLDYYPNANPPSEISGTEYDIARSKWGGNWRIPTRTEQIELVTKCTWTWTTQNGVKGCKVEGPSGNSIFLPAAGLSVNSNMGEIGENGLYWGGTLDVNGASYASTLFFNSSKRNLGNYYRYCGFPVRAVE